MPAKLFSSVRMLARLPRSAARARRRISRALCWTLVWFCLTGVAVADERPTFRVIAHPSVQPSRLEARFVAEVFLKKVTRWSNGASIHPVDLPPNSKTRQAFSQHVIKRSVSAVRSYWQQRIFSGRDIPPPEVDTEPAAVRFVATHVGAIGYVSAETDLSGVKIITIE